MERRGEEKEETWPNWLYPQHYPRFSDKRKEKAKRSEEKARRGRIGKEQRGGRGAEKKKRRCEDLQGSSL